MEGLESPRGAASSRSTGGEGGGGQGGDGSLVGSGNNGALLPSFLHFTRLTCVPLAAPKPSALAEEVASLVLASLQPQLDSLQAQIDALKAPVEEAYKETLLQKSERLNQRRRVRRAFPFLRFLSFPFLRMRPVQL